MDSSNYLIIAIEDSAERRLLKLSLATSGVSWVLEFAETFEQALFLAIKPQCACIVVDLSLPDYQGLDMLHRFKEIAPQATVVLLTDHSWEQVGLDAVAADVAQEFLAKDSLGFSFLPRVLRHIEKQQTLRNQLRTHQEVSQALLDSSHDAAWLLDSSGRILGYNSKALEGVNDSEGSIKNKVFFDLFPPQIAQKRRYYFEQALLQRSLIEFEDSDGQVCSSNRVLALPKKEGEEQQCAFFSRNLITEILVTHKGSSKEISSEQSHIYRPESLSLARQNVRMHMNKVMTKLESLAPMEELNDLKSSFASLEKTIHCIDEGSILERLTLEGEIPYLDILGIAPDLICFCTDDIIDYINPAGLDLLEVPSLDMVRGINFLDFVHPASLGEFPNGTKKLFATQESPIIVKIITGSGCARELELRSIPWNSEHYNSDTLLIGRDVTEATNKIRTALESEQSIRAVMDAVQDVIVTTDENDIIIDVNSAVKRAFGYEAERLIGQSIRVLIPNFDEYRCGITQNFNDYFDVCEHYEEEIIAYHSDGSNISLHLSIAPLQSNNKRFFISSLHNLGMQKNRQDEANYILNYDSVTKLPNRHLLLAGLESMLADADKCKGQVIIVTIDLIDFTTVSNSLGYALGNDVLKAVGERLAKTIKSQNGMVARLAGDEFIMILPHQNEHIPIAGKLKKINRVFSKPFGVGEIEINLSADMGVALFPRNGRTAMELINNAQMALHYVKCKSNENTKFFDMEMSNAANERLTLLHSFEKAISQEQFILHYQPQVRLKDWAVVGCEALVRWDHPVLGMLPPLRFIPLAEEVGSIIPLGHWVLNTACQQLRKWLDMGLPEMSMSVNVSGKQFYDQLLIDVINKSLVSAKLHPHMLDIELTESILMEDSKNTLELLQRLAQTKIHISIDDFGTGYSSLSYLRRFPVQMLKLDRSFVSNIDKDELTGAIARTVVHLAHSLSLEVIAEGVETIEEAIWLRECGCDQIQGFYVAKPMPADEMTKFLKNYDTVERPRIIPKI